MKEVFLESCYGLTVIVPSPDTCLLKEDLCLPVVALTLLSDSLADSWVVAVTTQLFSFFHMPYHLAQRSLQPLPVWECSQNTVPSKGFPPKPQDLLPGISEKLALLLEVRGDQFTGLRNFAQPSPEVLGNSDTLLCLGSFSGLKKGIITLLSGLGDGVSSWPPTLCHPARPAEGWLSHVHMRFGERGLPALSFSSKICQSQTSWDKQLLWLSQSCHSLRLLKFK